MRICSIGECMIEISKDINEKLGGFNLRLNDIADEIGSMDLSSPDALKRLNDLLIKL